MKQDQQDGVDVVQFDLRSLFLLTFLCAVAIALVLNLQIYGTVLLFVLGAAATWYLRTRCDVDTRRFWFQAVWGVLLPLACIFTDPFVFTSVVSLDVGSRAVPEASAVGFYAFMASEMMLLCASWILTPRRVKWAAFLSGSLLAGSVFAGIVAICLAPLALLFSVALLGLPGFTPWFTMIAYRNAFRRSWRVASRSPSRPVIFGLAGIGVAVPIALGLVAFLNWQ